MFDCDTLTGDCTFGVYWPWYRHGVRDIHGKVGMDGNMPVQDDHMQLGYTLDFAFGTIYACSWVAYNLLWWRKQRIMVSHNSKMLQNDDGAFWIQTLSRGWKEAGEVDRPRGWTDQYWPRHDDDDTPDICNENEDEDEGHRP
jgi:hypothetical protein